MSYDRSPFALTPWVRRLMMATAAVYLLQLTVFTSPWLTETFGFSPVDALSRPWGFLTYALLHAGFVHLFFNMLALFMFGPPVEARLGGRTFIRLYILAAIGGALLSLIMLPVIGDHPIVGASGAIFGVMLAFVLEWPDAPVLIFPFPMPIKAKWLLVFMTISSLIAGLSPSSGMAGFAHLGGFAMAFIYLRGGSLLSRPRVPRPVERAPAVLVRPTASDGVRRAEYTTSAPPRHTPDATVKAEVDRVLDKISERGMHSLTAEERRFLDEMSKRFRQDH